MVELTTHVINEIKGAQGETDIKRIILRAVDDLQNKNNYSGRSKRNFLINTIVALRYLKLEQVVLESEIPNIDKAIEIFEALRGKEYGKLF
jgi:hypothetical protein